MLAYILGLVLAGVVVQPIARRLDVPLAIAQVVCGLALSALPFVPRIEFDPALTFALFVPPLLYWAAVTSSLRDTRRNARAILHLATSLVLITTAAVAIVAHAAVPHLPWASAFVLGAIVAPPDADVTTSIARRLGVPPRIVTLLEGETLLNDTTAFVTYRVAVGAAVVGSFSLPRGMLEFLAIGAGGIFVGLMAGWLLQRITQRLSDSLAVTAVALVAPIALYLAAEWVKASGVLAVVTAGIIVSRFAPHTLSARSRVRVRTMYETVTFCLGTLVFMLIGIQLGRVAPAFWRDHSLLRVAALVSATVIVVRLVYVYPAAYLPRLLSSRIRESEPMPPLRSLAVVGWAGLRGGDTLVTALAVPLTTETGAPFPGRETVVAVAYGVIFATLILQGLTLRPFIRWIALPADNSIESEERQARVAMAGAATARLDVLAGEGRLSQTAVAFLREEIRLRTSLDLDDIDHPLGHDGRTDEDMLRNAEQELRNTAREALVRLRDDGVIGDNAMRRVQFDLDLQDVRETDEIWAGRTTM